MAEATVSEDAEGVEISPRWEAALLAFVRDQDRRGGDGDPAGVWRRPP